MKIINLTSLHKSRWFRFPLSTSFYLLLLSYFFLLLAVFLSIFQFVSHQQKPHENKSKTHVWLSFFVQLIFGSLLKRKEAIINRTSWKINLCCLRAEWHIPLSHIQYTRKLHENKRILTIPHTIDTEVPVTHIYTLHT